MAKHGVSSIEEAEAKEEAERAMAAGEALSVAISTSEKHGDGTVCYVIQATKGSASWQVQRRYNEFDQLRQEVEKAGVRIRSEFPKKKISVFGLGEQEVRERMQGLERYLQEAAAMMNGGGGGAGVWVWD